MSDKNLCTYLDVYTKPSIVYQFKGSLDLSHFIFEMNVGKTRIRHRTTLKLNDEFSKPTFSDIDFKK